MKLAKFLVDGVTPCAAQHRSARSFPCDEVPFIQVTAPDGFLAGVATVVFARTHHAFVVYVKRFAIGAVNAHGCLSRALKVTE